MGFLKRLPSVNLPRLAWAALIVALGASAWQLWQWQQARLLNRMLADGSLASAAAIPERQDVSYAAGWLFERLIDEDAKGLEDAVSRYTAAEASPDPRIASRAKFGLGNLYFRVGLRAADIAAGGSHVRGLAQLDLAREAYRGALRIDPDLREARYNLELLERLSPERRTQGWQRETRQMSLRQGEEQGWAGMQEHTLRGLP
ncbi:MAG: hypothetical protein ACT4QA_09125 [Panacagrimonas sp.]